MSDYLRQLAAGLKKAEKGQLNECFDPFHLDSRPNPSQKAIMEDINSVLYRYVVAGNQSGKSQLAGRELSWILNGSHPTWQRPERWKNEPILAIIAAQDLTMAETELWNKKVAPFLDLTEWRAIRSGGVLKRMARKDGTAEVVFLSHSDGSEKNRKHMQGYTAQYVWLDEMPASSDIFEELQRRTDKSKGPWIATFTPKFRNDKIRRVVDASDGVVAKKYQMSKLDNPIYAGDLDVELAKLAGYSEQKKRTVLYGDWSTGESAVYDFNYEQMVVDKLPDHYSKGWRHIESVDPAMKSKFGYTLWAEDPSTAIWYLVQDEYIQGMMSPTDLVETVRNRSQGYNITRRISDPHEAWYISQASQAGMTYMTPYDKNNRKHDLIKGLQLALSNNKIKIGAWCATFIDEIQSCQWSETSDRMINSSSYHTLDCSQYFADLIPEPDIHLAPKAWHTELRLANNRRKENQRASVEGFGQVTRRKRGPIDGWKPRQWGRSRRG